MNDRNNDSSQALPWTGERYLPEVGGDIELEHRHRYIFAKQFSAGKRVLDIASGEGYGSALLAKSAASVVGVDISTEAVAHATAKYQAANLEFRLGSCSAIPLADQSVDIVVSFETIEHHIEHHAMMREIKRVLVPGGLLIISSPDKREYSDRPSYANSYHLRELYREEFSSLLDAYFKNHRIAGQRVIYGSAIFEENSVSQVRSYDIGDESLIATPGIRNAVYLLAIASDGALPLTENCVLEASKTAVQQQLVSLGLEHDKVVAWAKELNQAVIGRDRKIADLELSTADMRQQLLSMGREHEQAIASAKDLSQTVIDLNNAVIDRDGQIVNLSDTLDRIVTAKEAEIQYLRTRLNKTLRSRYRRALAPLRSAVAPIRQGVSELRHGARKLFLLSQQDKASSIDPEVAGIDAATSNPSLPPCRDTDPIDAAVEDIKKSGLFDEAFYCAMYPELQLLPTDAIRHYCEHGWHEGRNPSEDFDTRSYLTIYSDIREAEINPLLHYVHAGASEGRLVGPDARLLDPDAETRYEDDIRFGFAETDIRLIAFYGSPDWAELRNGPPVSKGQSQPLLPHTTLGFYDPSDWKTLKRQSEMAKRHGLYGFCFPLDAGADNGAPSRSFDLFLSHDDVDFRFCVQIELRAGGLPESLVSSLERAVSDDRFIRIRGRAVILVSVSSEAQHAASALRELQKRLTDQEGFSPFLIGRYALDAEDDSGLSRVDFWDAVLDQPLAPGLGETGDYSPVNKNGVDVAPYCLVASQGVARARMAQDAAYPVFDCVTLGRDNTARKPARPLVYTRFHIKEYRRWMDAAIAGTRASHPEDRRLLFVNGWNDWNEGLFLEPDRQGGFCLLNETSRALIGVATGAQMPKVTVIVPNYNHERFLRRRLRSIYSQTYKNIEVILMDDASSDRSRFLLDGYAEYYPDITRTLYNDKNSGSPFRQWAKGIKAATGDLVWIAESDDYCDERFLEVLVRCFEDEAVLLAYSSCSFVDQNEVPVLTLKDYLNDLECADRWNSSYVATAHNEVKTALGVKNTIPNASGALFRRPIEMPLLDDESWLSMAVAGDWVFYLHLIRGGKIAYSTETTNFFRRYEGSAAQATYHKEAFYREVGMACRTVASLYNVPLAVLDQNRQTFKTLYDKKVRGSEEEFTLWYDYQSILDARESRLPNVMVATMGFYPGGAEILPIRLANEFKRQGLSVLLYSAGFGPREEGVRRMLRNDVPVVETSDVDDVKSIIHDFGVEVLNTHQWYVQKYPLQAPDVFKELGAHIASLHGMIEHGEAFAVTEDELSGADENVTTWVYTAEKNIVPFINLGLFDKSSPRFVKLPNGMQPPQIVSIPRKHMGIPEDAFTLCCVSRAIPDKGWAETILVVERARALSGRDIRLILVGNGVVYDEFCSTGVPDFVYLAGFSENSVGHYAAADMGIMLTRFKSESFPLTIVDCLFAGRPYIASDVGDIRNMLTTKDGLAGEVIELDNWEVQIEKCAQVVADFATDRQKYENSVSLVQDLVKRYKIDFVASQYIELFEADMKDTEAKKGGFSGFSPKVLAT